MRARLVIAGLAASALVLLPASAGAVLNGAPDTTHPYVVMLADGTTVCSGSLLSPTVVLTAAHCFAGDGEGAPVRVYFGQVPAPGTAFTGSYTFDPQWTGGNGVAHADTHDVAVVVFGTPIPASLTGGAYAALPGTGLVDTLRNNTPVDLVGYGVQGFARGGGPPQPVGGFTRFITQTSTVGGNSVTSDEFLKLHSGTCFGDSGGPVLLGGTNVVLAENSFVDNNLCAGNTYAYRVDTAQAQAWIAGAVAAAGGSLSH